MIRQEWVYPPGPLVCSELYHLGIPTWPSRLQQTVPPGYTQVALSSASNLTLNKENNEATNANVLDLNIKIENGKFICRVYDKRDNIKFNVV